MSLLNNPLYIEDLENVINEPLPWDELSGKNIVIAGGSGLIGSFLIDCLMYKNKRHSADISVYALCRNKERAEKRFGDYIDNKDFNLIIQDVCKPLELDVNFDYIIHAASNAHPLFYATQPINTMLTNITGTANLLEYAALHSAKRFLFVSSVEIYGENCGDTEKFKEDYLGYIDCNTLRAGYPESKRAGEALCQAYIAEKGVDIVIARLSRTFGPTMLTEDSKAISQFIKNGIENKDIILKSNGSQLYSYAYAADAVTGLFYCLLSGKNGSAYNICGDNCDISLCDLAGVIAQISRVKVGFDVPDKVEKAGYSKATKALLDNEKVKSLGFTAKYSMRSGLMRTIDMLK